MSQALPRGWVTTRLGDVAQARMGKTILSKELSASGIPVFSASVGEEPWGYVTDSDTIFPRGTLVISARGTIGDVKLPNYDRFVSTQTTIALTPSRAVDPSFLAFQLRCADWPSVTATTAIPMLTIGKAVDLPLLLPPVPEQRRIVARIEALFARTRRARADLERAPALQTHYRSRLLASEFGEFEGRAPYRDFFEVLDFEGGTQPPKDTFSAVAQPGYVRLLQIRDFASDDKAVFIRDSHRWKKCRSDDILVGRYGASVGKILRGKSGAYNVALVKIVIEAEVLDREFVFWWLQSPGFQDALGVVSRSAQDGFNKADLRSLRVPCPPLDEQRRCAARIEARIRAVGQARAEAERGLALLDRLEQSILAKAFRGELVPQDPSDEPAEALLARLRNGAQTSVPRRRGRRAA